MGSSQRTKAKPSCVHCGAPLLDERAKATGYCCSGCSYVHRMISESGLGDYYKFKDANTAPADSSVFLKRDYAWLETLQKDTEQRAGDAGNAVSELTLGIQGISCAGCVWLVERVCLQEPGARDARVNPQMGELQLSWNPGFSLPSLAARLQSFGYLLGPLGERQDDGEVRDIVRRMGLCAAFSMNVMLFTLPSYFGMEAGFEYARLFSTLSLGLATLSMLVGGSYFMGRAFKMLRSGELHIDLPISLGILGAYLGSLWGWLRQDEAFIYFDFVAMFILLMLSGRWAQVVAVERNQRTLLRQQIRPPAITLRQTEGQAPLSVKVEDLQPGQAFLLKPGETLAVDAKLLTGEAELSLASINGEAAPRLFRPGERLPSGALNIGRAALELEALQPWNQSLLARLIQTNERLGWRHRFLERVIRGYLIGILLAALGGGIAWWLLTGDAAKTWSVVTAVLVVSCPCAIGLAFPLADEIATTVLKRLGVYVRENDLWGKLGQVKALVFDKTGTLTLETPELDSPEELGTLDENARAILYSLVQGSAHPLSQSLLAELLSMGPQSRVDAEVHEHIGKGLELQYAGACWRLGKPEWAIGAPPAPDKDEAINVALAKDGECLHSFIFHDHARADARVELSQLQQQGFKLHILSGDLQAKVDKLALELGIQQVNAHGGLSPENKAAWMQANHPEQNLMLGDGANDSLAFDRALCRGTPVIHRGLLENKADFFYLGRGLRGIRALFEINRIRANTQNWVLVFSVLYNALAVGLALAGFMNPLVAAVLMPANSILTLLLVSWRMKPAFRF